MDLSGNPYDPGDGQLLQSVTVLNSLLCELYSLNWLVVYKGRLGARKLMETAGH